MKIFLNPGHCIGLDSGACGFGLSEADVALNIALKVKEFLEAVHYDVKLFYFDGLAEIVDTSNYWNSDLFVSIHCNAFDGKAHGTETIYFSDEGERLADCIQRQIVSTIGTLDRGIKNKIAGGYDSFVCKYTFCPAVLVETAFIDNPSDNALLADNQFDFARAIACGITDYVADFYLPQF